MFCSIARLNANSMVPSWTVLAAVVLAQCVGHVVAECSIRHSALLTKAPLLLANNSFSDARRFVASSDTGYTTLKEGEPVTIACPGSYNYMFGGNTLLLQSVDATCVSGYRFQAGARTITLNQVECYQQAGHDVRVAGPCAEEGVRLQAGFDVAGAFITLYEVCLDQQRLAPLSATHYVRRGARISRTSTLSALFYADVNPSADYTRASQITSFTKQLDSKSATKYITTTNYLEAKLLVPYQDFVYPMQQYATYFYFNSVPLWKEFHSSFWSSLESSIRTLTVSDGDLQVFMAAVGTAQLADSDGEERPVHLVADGFMPLPEMLVKSVRNSREQEVIFLQIWHQRAGSRAAALQRQVQASACAEDVCAQLRWLPWRSVPAEQRPIICCRADDTQLLRRLPQLQKQRAADGPAGAPLLVGSASEDFYARA